MSASARPSNHAVHSPRAFVVNCSYLNKMNINLAVIAIGVDYAQVVSMFARTKIRWPPLLKQLFQILSAFNLNLEITAPECLNPEVQFWQKWCVFGHPLALASAHLRGAILHRRVPAIGAPLLAGS